MSTHLLLRHRQQRRGRKEQEQQPAHKVDHALADILSCQCTTSDGQCGRGGVASGGTHSDTNGILHSSRWWWQLRQYGAHRGVEGVCVEGGCSRVQYPGGWCWWGPTPSSPPS